MQIKCVAIDDEPHALDLMKRYISRIPALSLVQVFDDAIAAAEFVRRNPVDLLFLDINMPDINGLELVRSLTEKPLIIFTTAYKKFAFEGFELEALDYLLKPIEFERFSKAVHKAIEYTRFVTAEKKEQGESLFVRSEYKLVKIDLNEIEYIESLEDYLKINLSSGKPVMTLMTLKAILERLPPEKFQRIHRSYVVAVAKIKSVSGRKVRLANAELPISDSYTDFIDRWLK